MTKYHAYFKQLPLLFKALAWSDPRVQSFPIGEHRIIALSLPLYLDG